MNTHLVVERGEIGDPEPPVLIVPERPEISVELVDASAFHAATPAWQDLLTRAATPNVFMDPSAILAAATSFIEIPLLVLLAWYTCGGVRRLAGALALAAGHPQHSLLPIRTLNAPFSNLAFLGSPVIDRAHAEAVWRAFLDRLAAEPGLARIVTLSAARDDETLAALRRVLDQRGAPHRTLAHLTRPELASPLDAKAYFAEAMSASTRKKLRQHRRALEKRGTLASHKAVRAEEVSWATERFLRLEAAGWKGRNGTALFCNPAETAFTRRLVRALAERGATAIYELSLDGVPIAMQIVLRAGDTAFTWKTAYAEAFADFSPGMLLLEDYTADLLADPQVRVVDSCAHDQTSFMRVWREQREVVDVWFSAKPNRLTFHCLAAMQLASDRGRAAAKHFYQRLPRRTSHAKAIAHAA